jgi:hypothetical protein
MLISLWGGNAFLPPILPVAPTEEPAQEEIALDEPTPTSTTENPPPPPLMPPQDPTPTITEELEPTIDPRCEIFQDLEMKLVLLSIPEETMVLPVYVKMTGGIPCLGVESPEVSEPCEYGAKLGNLEAYTCGLQGFEDRLYCLFKVTPDLPGLGLDFELHLNDCQFSIYQQAMVLIPDIVYSDSPSCSASLAKQECQSAGGRWSGTAARTPYCICP